MAPAVSCNGSRRPGRLGQSRGQSADMLGILCKVWMSVMTAPLKAVEKTGDISAVMRDIGARARAAGRSLPLASAADKNRALAAMAAAIRSHAAEILAANAEDIAAARSGGATAAFVDR